MSNKLEISICIATWCRKNELKKIIELLENQTIERDRYEIIVCDSYSPDGTDKIMQDLKNIYKNIKYINTKKNVLAVKRNIGIDNSESEIVVFMDDDVFPTNTFIEKHINAHKKVNNTIFCGQVRFPKEWVEKSNYYRFRDDSHLKNEKIFDDLPFNKIVVMNMSFKKKEFLKKVGYVCEDFIGYGGEDTELGFRLIENGMKMKYLDEALAYHHEKSESIIKYGEKIFRSGRDGCRTLNSINKNILKNTNIKYFLEDEMQLSNFEKVKYKIYKIIVNKFFANIIGKILIYTDGKRNIYFKSLYRYYIAYKYKEGILKSKDKYLSLEDVKNGWYD